MKRFTPLAAFLFLLPIITSSMVQAEPDPMQQMEARIQKRQAARLEMLTKKLALTNDQKRAVKAALDNEGIKEKALNMEAMEKRKALNEETVTRINTALSPSQKTKWVQLKSEMRANRAKNAMQKGPGPKKKK